MSTADLIGWIGALSGGFMTAIQYVRARRVGVDGISPLTWSLFLMMGIFWMAYGLEEHSACMVVGTLMVAPVQAAILFAIGFIVFAGISHQIIESKSIVCGQEIDGRSRSAVSKDVM